MHLKLAPCDNAHGQVPSMGLQRGDYIMNNNRDIIKVNNNIKLNIYASGQWWRVTYCELVVKDYTCSAFYERMFHVHLIKQPERAPRDGVAIWGNGSWHPRHFTLVDNAAFARWRRELCPRVSSTGAGRRRHTVTPPGVWAPKSAL